MKLYELKKNVDFLISNGHEQDAVLITLSDSSVGARASTGITGIYSGFDWEHGQVRIAAERKFTTYENNRDREMIPVMRDYDIGSRIRHLLICPRCENHLRKDDNYCSHCGQKIKK